MDAVVEHVRELNAQIVDVSWERFRIDPMRDGPGARMLKLEGFMMQFIDRMKGIPS